MNNGKQSQSYCKDWNPDDSMIPQAKRFDSKDNDAKVNHLSTVFDAGGNKYCYDLRKKNEKRH